MSWPKIKKERINIEKIRKKLKIFNVDKIKISGDKNKLNKTTKDEPTEYELIKKI